MIQVWLYDENKVFIESKLVEELKENMTDIPLLVGYIKPTFNVEKQEWKEGATEEEIKAWLEQQKPQEPKPTLEQQLEEANKRVNIMQEQLKNAIAENTLTLSMIEESSKQAIAEMSMALANLGGVANV